MGFWKKWLNIALTAVLMLTLLTPATATIANAEELNTTAEQTENLLAVQVEIDGLDKKIVESTTTNIAEGTKAIDAVKQVLDNAKIAYEVLDGDYGPYIKSIEGLAAGKFNGWDGWMYTVNGQAPSVGLGAYPLAANDVLKVYYSKYPVLSAVTTESNGQQAVTLNLVGDHFSARELVTALENWEVPAEVTLQSVIRYSNEKVTLKIQANPGTYTIKALAPTLTSAQQAEVTIEVKDAVAETVRLIEALPTIEELSETNKLALKAARAAFDALTAEQQALVTNSNELIEKENTFKTLNAVTVTVNVRVEGIKDTTLNVKNFVAHGDGEVTAAGATLQVLEANKIPTDYSTSTGYFKSINNDGERALGDGSGWMYKVNGVYPDVYGNGYVLKDGDEIVWEFINSFSVRENYDYNGVTYMYSGADTVDVITFNPIIEMSQTVQAGQDVTIKVTGNYNTIDYMFEKKSGPHAVALEDVSIEYNGKVYKTVKHEETIDDETVVYGKAVIPAEDVVPGTFELRFTKDLPGTIKDASGKDKVLESFPRILRTYKTLEVLEVSQDNRKLAQDALALGNQYLTTNNELVSKRVNESSSGFWMLAALKAAGVNVTNYPWTTAPTAEGTFWKTNLEEPLKTADQKLGSIIAATALGLDPTNLKGRNQVADLLAGQNEATHLMATIYSEPLALIALDLVKADYDRQQHIKAILNLQNSTTGFWSGGIDITGWALFALAPYKDQPEVKAAIDKAVAALHKNYQEKGFTNNANTMAAMISGLASAGEDVFSEKWTYVKDGKHINIVGHLVENYIFEDGGVRFLSSQNKSSLMAVEQVYVALFDALNNKSTFSTLNEGTQAPTPTEPGENTGGGTTSPEQPAPTPTTDKVTMSIAISSSEVVLPSEQFDINADETAFDLLKRVTQAKNIALNARETSMGMYVVGIAGINEFDRGKLSGWMYSVNGAYPSVSANQYVLEKDDVVNWVYTTDLGEDVGSPSVGGGVATETPKEPEKVEEKPTEATLNEVTAEQLKDKEQIVVKDKSGIEVSVPTAGLQLKDDEKLVVAVQNTTEKIEVNLNIVAEDGTTTAVNTGKNYVKVTLTLETKDSNLVVLQLVDGQYRAVPHTVVDGVVTILTKTSGTFIVSNEQVSFSDIDNLFSKEEIEFLANRHVVLGADGAFMPNSALTRGQFAMMIARALGLQTSENNPFTDTVGKEYEKDVQALFEAGITTGTSDTTFDPTAKITREQSAAFMARVFEYMGMKANTSSTVSYSDDEAISSVYAAAIALLAEYDIMTGKSDGTFDPKGHLSRAEMAKIFKRTLNKAGLM
ncbi:DUF4430 domain-containing protein [Solibacillus sp. FSL H8-0523]|uniref:DUF4430 domain-containing protein n=1 Tax=Solibacillus sp. FSL H8-0523 TaxID=2954511 RepID=UPI0031015D73